MGTVTPHFKSRVMHFGLRPMFVQAFVMVIEFSDH